MAKNDSLIYINNGVASAFKIVDISNTYIYDSETNTINLKSGGLVAQLQLLDFRYNPTSVEVLTFKDLINEVLEENNITVLNTRRISGVFEDFTPYREEYTHSFVITDTKTGKEYALTYEGAIYPNYANNYTDLVNMETVGITEYNGVGSFSKPPYDSIFYVNKQQIGGSLQAEISLSVALIYDENNKANLIFITKYGTTDDYISFSLTNDSIMTNAMLQLEETYPHNIKSLSFKLVDGDNFEYGEEGTPGGYSGGTFDNSSDNIGIPSDPGFDFTTQGCGVLYKINNLANVLVEIFPTIDESATGIDFLKNMFEIQQSDSLKQFVIDAYALPVSPIVGTSTPIKIGWKFLQQSAPKVVKQWVTVSCGTYSLREYFSNFLDYEGTEIKLYLPFYGFIDINPEFIVSGSIEVVYKFDVVSGEFIVYVKSNSGKSNLNSVIGQYSGNAITHIPINAVNSASKVNGLLQGATNITNSAIQGATGLLTGNLSTMVGSAEKALEGTSQIANAKPTASLSNSYSGSSALMGIRIPFFLISRPSPQFSSTYRQEVGLPLNVSRKLNTVEGFTICQLDDIAIERATKEERDEIVNILRNGIIL